MVDHRQRLACLSGFQQFFGEQGDVKEGERPDLHDGLER